MIYLDTSLVVALCTREPASDRVEAALRSMSEPFMSSEWTRVEYTSAIGLKLRTHELGEALARQALAKYYEAFEPGVTLIVPSHEDYISAADLLQGFERALRSGDALHLAIAINRQATGLLTLDRAFIKAAADTPVPVALPW